MPTPDTLDVTLRSLTGLSRSGFVVALMFVTFAWCFGHIKRWADLARLLFGLLALAGLAIVALLML